MRTRRNRRLERSKTGAARKGSPVRRRGFFKIGDRVRVVDIPVDLKDANYDTKDSDRREMRTAELFRFCVGRDFTVYGFGRYGHVELHVGKSPPVRKRFGWSHTIWIEPEFLKRVRKAK